MNVLHLLIGEDCCEGPEITLEIIHSECTHSEPRKALGTRPTETKKVFALNVLKRNYNLPTDSHNCFIHGSELAFRVEFYLPENFCRSTNYCRALENYSRTSSPGRVAMQVHARMYRTCRYTAIFPS